MVQPRGHLRRGRQDGGTGDEQRAEFLQCGTLAQSHLVRRQKRQARLHIHRHDGGGCCGTVAGLEVPAQVWRQLDVHVRTLT
jgi:hypothetical protein